MYELILSSNSNEIILFTTEEKAEEYAESIGATAYAIHSPGTFTIQPEFEE